MRTEDTSRRHEVARRWLPGAVLVAGVILVAAHLGEEEQFAALARRARPAWLLAAAALQLATYAVIAWLWLRVLRRLGQRSPPLRSLMGLALAELFTDQALPSGGLSGTLLVVRALESRGVPKTAAGGAVVASSLGLQAATALALLAALVELALHHDVTPAVLVVLAAAAAFAAFVAGGIILLQRSAGAHLPAWLARLPGLGPALALIPQASRAATRDGRLLIEATALRLGIIVLDAVTLQTMLAAVGHQVDPGAAFAALVCASAAGNVSFLPGGLGAFEAACVGVLSLLRVPVEAAITATLLLRGATFWLPMLPGLWFARRAVGGAPM